MTIKSVSRVAILTILISLILTAAFHWAYAAVAVSAGLLFEFVLLAFVLTCAVEFAIRSVRSGREPKNVEKP